MNGIKLSTMRSGFTPKEDVIESLIAVKQRADSPSLARLLESLSVNQSLDPAAPPPKTIALRAFARGVVEDATWDSPNSKAYYVFVSPACLSAWFDEPRSSGPYVGPAVTVYRWVERMDGTTQNYFLGQPEPEYIRDMVVAAPKNGSAPSKLSDQLFKKPIDLTSLDLRQHSFPGDCTSIG